MSDSFPLMAIARRYGVDYGDVLLISMQQAAGRALGELPPARRIQCAHATKRAQLAIRRQAPTMFHSIAAAGNFASDLDAHAKRRWGCDRVWR